MTQKIVEKLPEIQAKDPEKFQEILDILVKLDKEARENLPEIQKGNEVAFAPALAIPAIYEAVVGAAAVTGVVYATKDARNDSIERVFGSEQGTSINEAVSQEQRVKNNRTGETGYEQDDGSVMVKDRAGIGHGGSVWKRYNNKREWESKNAQREGTYDENGKRLRD